MYIVYVSGILVYCAKKESDARWYIDNKLIPRLIKENNIPADNLKDMSPQEVKNIQGTLNFFTVLGSGKKNKIFYYKYFYGKEEYTLEQAFFDDHIKAQKQLARYHPIQTFVGKHFDMLLYALAALCIYFVLDKCDSDFREEQHQKFVQSYQTYNPSFELDMNIKSGWTGNYGGVDDNRKELLRRIDTVYGQDRYKHQKTRLHANLDGNILYLSSVSFKDEYSRDAIKGLMDRMFIDCELAEVRLMKVYTGGAQYWTIYSDPTIKPTPAPKKKFNHKKVHQSPATDEDGVSVDVNVDVDVDPDDPAFWLNH